MVRSVISFSHSEVFPLVDVAPLSWSGWELVTLGDNVRASLQQVASNV